MPPSSGWFWVAVVDEGEGEGGAVLAGAVDGVEGDVGVGAAAGAGVVAGALVAAALAAAPGVAAFVVGVAAVGVGVAGFAAAAAVPDAPPVCAFASPNTEHQAARPKTRNSLLRRMDEP